MAEKQAEQAVERQQVNMGDWISRAWDMVTADLGPFIILGLIYLVIVGVTSSLVIVEFVVLGPLAVGFFLVVFEKIRGREVNIGDIAKGFNYFVPAVLSNILITVFTVIGFVFCIIPGFIIAALYLFTPAFILEQKLDFWEAMEASRKVVMQHLFELIIFVIILGLINLVGALLCGIGLVFTIPLTFAAMGLAYDDLVGIEKTEG